jgi:protein-S-isoprenylcysteine O-methyltransferase Ste14
MSGARNWAAGAAIAALMVLSPVVALLMVITAEMLIDLVIEAGAAAVCTVTAGVIGWVLFRRMSSHPGAAPQSGSEQVSDEAVMAAPPM